MPTKRKLSHEKIIIIPGALNNLENQRASYFLHRLLTELKNTIQLGDYSFADAKVTLQLTNTLTPVIDKNKDVIYYQIDGDDAQRIYLFSMGLCYYEGPLDPESKLLQATTEALVDGIVILSRDIKTRIDEFNAVEYKKLSLHYLYDTPVIYDFYKLRLATDHIVMGASRFLTEAEVEVFLACSTHEVLKIKFMCLKNVSERLVFLTHALDHANEAWVEENVPNEMFVDNHHNEFYRYFFQSSPHVYAYFEAKPYLFQGKKLIFPRRLVARDRQNKQGEKKSTVIDIMKEKALAKLSKTDIYDVDAILDLKPDEAEPLKTKTKNDKVYKFDFSTDDRAGLKGEFEKAQAFSRELHASNYHPGLYSMRHKGLNLEKFSEKFNEIYNKSTRENLSTDSYKEFIKFFLEVAYKMYERLTRYNKFQCHGDIKPENVLIKPQVDGHEVTLIDASHHYTVRYASPETLRSKTTSHRGDIYSAARTLVRLFGDSHRIFSMGASSNQSELAPQKLLRLKILDILEVEQPNDTLSDFDEILSFFVSKKVISENMQFQVWEFFLRLHSKDAENRPTVIDATEKFKDLYRGYCQTLENEKNLSRRAALWR